MARLVEHSSRLQPRVSRVDRGTALGGRRHPDPSRRACVRRGQLSGRAGHDLRASSRTRSIRAGARKPGRAPSSRSISGRCSRRKRRSWLRRFSQGARTLRSAASDRAAGNPLFLEQLLRNAEEGEGLRYTELGAEPRASEAGSPSPAPDKAAFQAASVLGQRSTAKRWRIFDEPDYRCQAPPGEPDGPHPRRRTAVRPRPHPRGGLRQPAEEPKPRAAPAHRGLVRVTTRRSRPRTWTARAIPPRPPPISRRRKASAGSTASMPGAGSPSAASRSRASRTIALPCAIYSASSTTSSGTCLARWRHSRTR